jgi:hypothetical protein
MKGWCAQLPSDGKTCAQQGRGPRQLNERAVGRRHPFTPGWHRKTSDKLLNVRTGGTTMPEKAVVAKAKKDLRQGKSASTAAGEFVHEEIEHVRQGRHGARSPEQAIAIGLSKARRAGVPLKPPAKGKTSAATRKKAERDYATGRTSPKSGEEGKSMRGKSRMRAMKRESRASASHASLSRHARSAAKKRRKG